MKIETRIVSPGPLGMAVSVRRVNGDSSTQEFEYTTNLDGKSYPMIGQGPYGANSIAANLTAPNTIQSTFSRDNKVVATATSLVSNGGKVLTITTKGTDTNGKPFTSNAGLRQTVVVNDKPLDTRPSCGVRSWNNPSSIRRRMES